MVGASGIVGGPLGGPLANLNEDVSLMICAYLICEYSPQTLASNNEDSSLLINKV